MREKPNLYYLRTLIDKSLPGLHKCSDFIDCYREEYFKIFLRELYFLILLRAI